MKRTLPYIAGIIGLAIVSTASNVFAQTTANGPYYATPSWDQTLPAATRFIVLSNFASNAVLDRETGLVWERSPSASRMTWFLATGACEPLSNGGRLGWRLPTIQELASLLVDPGVPVNPDFPGPTLPAGHPFIAVQDAYWSATAVANIPDGAWLVAFGGIATGVTLAFKTGTLPVWCVRGGLGLVPK
jgi:hypothetical protein